MFRFLQGYYEYYAVAHRLKIQLKTQVHKRVLHVFFRVRLFPVLHLSKNC